MLSNTENKNFILMYTSYIEGVTLDIYFNEIGAPETENEYFYIKFLNSYS